MILPWSPAGRTRYTALELLAMLAAVEGQHPEAGVLWHEALPLAEALGERVNAANIRAGLAQAPLPPATRTRLRRTGAGR